MMNTPGMSLGVSLNYQFLWCQTLPLLIALADHQFLCPSSSIFLISWVQIHSHCSLQHLPLLVVLMDHWFPCLSSCISYMTQLTRTLACLVQIHSHCSLQHLPLLVVLTDHWFPCLSSCVAYMTQLTQTLACSMFVKVPDCSLIPTALWKVQDLPVLCLL